MAHRAAQLALIIITALAVGYTAGYVTATTGPLRGFILFSIVAAFAIGFVARLACYLLDLARFARKARR